MSTSPTKIRLNKFLAERLGLSRREADDLIAAGKVLVNNQPAILGTRIDKNDKVCYNKKIVPFQTDYLYLAFHKPVGYICSRRAQGQTPTLYQLLPPEYRQLKTVGRLDKDSSGLILLTNDGDFAYKMTHPKFRKEKIYEVTLDQPLQPLHQQMISDYGIKLSDGVSKFTIFKDPAWEMDLADFQRESEPEDDPAKHLIVTLTEGRNRQIRRTFDALGYKVKRLHRTKFGPFLLNNLRPGKYTEIQP